MEAFAGNPGHFAAARFLVFSPRGQACAGFAGGAECLIGFGKGAARVLVGGIFAGDDSFRLGQFLAQPFADGIALFYLAHQSCRLGRIDRLILLDFLQPLGKVR